LTIYGQVDGLVVGQPLNPNFGAANGAQAPSAGLIQQPTTAPTAGGMQATGVQMTLLEACSRGIVPRNAQLATISGQAVSVGVSALQGDGMSVDEGLSSGNGAQTSLGVAVPPNGNNPNSVTIMGVNNQAFVDGIANANDGLSTGPTPFNTESVVSAPTPGSTTTANVTLLTGVYAG
jgi:hypothetical protein